MNSFKKLLCLLLASSFIVSGLASCANNEDDDSDETQGTVTEPAEDVPVFEDEDFEEAEFKFLYLGPNESDFVDEYIWSDGVTGSAISDAVAERNRKVEEKYNVKVVAEVGGIGEAITRMQAGQCDIAVVYDWASRYGGAALDGMLYDFYDLPYVDLEQSYWVPSMVESMTIADRMFVSSSMVTMNSIAWAGINFFNKMLMDKLGYEYPYVHVENNTWTVDTAIEMLQGAEEDVDGDGEMTIADQYGALGMGLSTYYEPLIVEEDDGSYTVVGYTEKMVAAYNKYKNTIDQLSIISLGDLWDQVDRTIMASEHAAVRYTVFGEDHALFMGGSIDITKELVNMDSDYGVVPEVKPTADDDYISYVDSNAPQLAIPVQIEDPEMVGMILEYMSYESEQEVLPAFYETTIKTKRMEDVRDYDMLDIVRESAVYDAWGGIYLNGLDDSAVQGLRGKMEAAGSFKSVWARYGSKAQAEVDSVVEILESIE